MKRHPALQSLSREHHPALVLAMACKRAAQLGDKDKIQETCERVERVFSADLESHFRQEEDALLPLLHEAGETALVQRTLNEHGTLRALAGALRSPDAARLAEFGQALSEHVRFEEQMLFSVAEQIVPEDLLEAALGHPSRSAST